MDQIISTLTNRREEAASALKEFVDKSSGVFSFSELNQEDLQESLWDSLFSVLQEKKSDELHRQCLSALRVVSRDKTGLNTVCTEDRIELLMSYGRFTGEDSSWSSDEVAIEALKCMSNIVYNSSKARKAAVTLNLVEGIFKRVGSYQPTELPNEMMIFDVKLLFLLTALDPSVRIDLSAQTESLESLVDLLETSWNKVEEFEENLDTWMKLISEILKALFNIVLPVKTGSKDWTQFKETLFLRLIGISSKILCHPRAPFLVQSDVINLLTLMPLESFSSLVSSSCSSNGQPGKAEMQFVDAMVAFLDKSLSDAEEKQGSQSELLSPILLTLSNVTKSNKIFRKYLRSMVLPHLKDVYQRPEQGNTLRNKLCRLLTSPVTSVTDLAADWLFLLCKENVGRMVKYTGYGNAAGLLARKGLMGGAIDYDSDSEDSDTEEYLENKHLINPILGCRTEPTPNPVASMTDEEKEYLAMELVNKIDLLQRRGVIQPCRVGEDGRPTPIEHVMQLQDEVQRSSEQRSFMKNDCDD